MLKKAAPLDLLLEPFDDFRVFSNEMHLGCADYYLGHQVLDEVEHTSKYYIMKRSTPKQFRLQDQKPTKRALQQPKGEELVLPIAKYKNQIVDLVCKNQVTVISGETGSGKTTQVPQYLFDHFSSICITQPRRISAITLAKRVAQQLHFNIGQQVGYSVRFEDCRGEKTRITFLTDGMAIREMMLKKKYEVFILDQAHERSVNTDVLLALLKKLLKITNKLKLVIMSATMDVAKFMNFFSTDSYLKIEGRTFPVGLYYLPEPVADYVYSVINTVLQIHMQEKQGDILVFLTGQQEILTAEKLLKSKSELIPPSHSQLIITPLFSALPSQSQLKAFQKTPQGYRKVILSTNIAETSVTISGVKYVVDCGFSKVRVFDHQRNMEILAVAPESKANALQRAGRAGRVSEGKCFRLYMKSAYEQLPDYHLPELLRVDITGCILQVKAIGIKKIKDLEFVDPPPAQSIDFSLKLLKQIKAIDGDQQITVRGKQLSQLPLSPELSNLLLLSLEKEYSCASVMLSCISILSIQNLFYVPQKQSLIKVLKRYQHKNSDHLTKVNLFHYYLNSSNKKSFCKQNFVNSKNIKRAVQIRQQLRQYLIDINKKRSSLNKEEFQISQKYDADGFLKCLSKGTISKKARLNNSGAYLVNGSNQTAKIHPQSICFLSKDKPEVIVFNQIVKTQRIYLRDVSQVM